MFAYHISDDSCKSNQKPSAPVKSWMWPPQRKLKFELKFNASPNPFPMPSVTDFLGKQSTNVIIYQFILHSHICSITSRCILIANRCPWRLMHMHIHDSDSPEVYIAIALENISEYRRLSPHSLRKQKKGLKYWWIFLGDASAYGNEMKTLCHMLDAQITHQGW